jgi:Glyoxalase/Bleomycin resistance protein/Dioxygenase superfamily
MRHGLDNITHRDVCAAVAGGRPRSGDHVLGFSFSPTCGGFYAIGERDGFQVHLKCAPKTVADRAHRLEREHLDIYAGVVGVDALYDECKAKGATITKPLASTAWGTRDFYIMDPEGYILAFGENQNAN